MNETLIAVVFFLCLSGAGLGVMALHKRLPRHHRDDATMVTVRACANIFVVTTSLLLGLLINSAKNTFENVDKSVHAYATELILLDRTMRQYGSDTAAARASLLAYTRQAAARMAQSDPLLSSANAEQLLRTVGHELRALRPGDTEHAQLRQRAEERFDKVYEMRWALIEQSEGSIPAALIGLLGAWLVMAFASFGYRAPHNALVVSSFVVSAALLAGAIYLALDMDVPFQGSIQISPAPLERAVAEIER
jgi:hypothetical protein